MIIILWKKNVMEEMVLNLRFSLLVRTVHREYVDIYLGKRRANTLQKQSLTF